MITYHLFTHGNKFILKDSWKENVTNGTYKIMVTFSVERHMFPIFGEHGDSYTKDSLLFASARLIMPKVYNEVETNEMPYVILLFLPQVVTVLKSSYFSW